jgi:sirohydrochlorin cobaltochelatase
MILNAPLTGTLLVVSGSGTDEILRQSAELTDALQAQLSHAVALCLGGDAGASVVAGIRTLVGGGAQRLVVLPLDLSPEQDERPVPEAVQWASRRWPFLTFHAASPLSWTEWACCLRAAALDALGGVETAPEQAAVLIAGSGRASPLTNANVARLAHLVWEASDFARVDHAFLHVPCLAVSLALQVPARLGLRNIVVVPWLLDLDDGRHLASQVDEVARELELSATLAATPLVLPVLIDTLVAHHQAALADHSFLAPTWTEIQAEIARTTGTSTHSPGQRITDDEAAQLRELDRKINAMLPPQYQGRYEQIRPESMGSASLRFRPDGMVAWDEMWTSFCDLALAGGPPHRGRLLEAGSAADATAEPEKYKTVVAEIERGIRLVTGLSVVPSSVLGWVGVRCHNEEMAIWLMRAIIVENVMVRREGDVLYLPADSKFTLQREIKNVVTVIAKTAHYWTSHLVSQSRQVCSQSTAEETDTLK